MQVYSDPSRASDPHALPDVEVFYAESGELATVVEPFDDEDAPNAEGWYYWFCFSGCLPDSDPVGPFATAEEAKAAAQSEAQS